MITVAKLHRRALLGTAILGTLGVISGSPVLLAAGSATLAALLFAGRDLHATERGSVRRWGVHLLTVLLVAVSILEVSRIGIDAIFLILMAGLLNRVLLRNGQRDDFLIIGASAVLIAAATLVSSGVSFAVLLMLFVPAVVLALWSSMILGASERDPGQRQQMLSRSAPRGGLGIALSGLLATALCFGLVAALPRYRFVSFLGAGAFASLPGASDRMTLDVGGLGDMDDETVILRVTPGEGATRGDLDGLYARLYALEDFDGKTWTSADTGSHLTWRPAKVKDERPRAKLALSRLTRGKTHHPVALLGTDEPWAVENARIHVDTGGTAVIDRLTGRSFDYETIVGRQMTWQKDRPSEASLAVPEELHPKVRELGQQLAEGKRTDQEKIDAVLRHFSRGFSYSLEPLQGEHEDPLTRFLFEAKRGHCELYAGAVAILLRVGGVPARVVTGYYRGRWNPIADYLAFAQGDAHAWVEVWTEGKGWRWIDATPPDLRARRSQTALQLLRDWYDAIDGLWFEHVVDFDAAKQMRYYAAISRRIDALTDRFGELSFGGGSLQVRGGSGALGLVLAVASVPALIAGIWALRRRRDPVWLGKRLRRLLEERPGENAPLERLVERSRDVELATRAAAAYQALRFGPPGAARRGEAAALIDALARARRRKTG